MTGDAGGFALNMGVTVRGMEFAIASGIFAAETVISAKTANDFSEKTLSLYENKLKDSFVLKYLSTFRKLPDFLENRLYLHYIQSCYLTY